MKQAQQCLHNNYSFKLGRQTSNITINHKSQFENKKLIKHAK